MRDQILALSYAAAISGGLLLVLEWLILDRAVFWRTSPYMITPFVLGVAGIYWIKVRKPVAGLSGPIEPISAPEETSETV